ncbi:Eukaryotic translation initiation factor 3 subunit A [Dissostichus eleginoides]|uniref:Eukaryotic translation initiation factor 3 subunit A n=1 Tax=Dissostichus eleginoides TaxID=100907 RepID=A0AAD9FGQ1_DISEL|nr:Eukaryotic translation initiation factor 3 subunit A [Dissostichus eleginoides]
MLCLCAVTLVWWMRLCSADKQAGAGEPDCHKNASVTAGPGPPHTGLCICFCPGFDSRIPVLQEEDQPASSHLPPPPPPLPPPPYLQRTGGGPGLQVFNERSRTLRGHYFYFFVCFWSWFCSWCVLHLV